MKHFLQNTKGGNGVFNHERWRTIHSTLTTHVKHLLNMGRMLHGKGGGGSSTLEDSRLPQGGFTKYPPLQNSSGIPVQYFFLSSLSMIQRGRVWELSQDSHG